MADETKVPPAGGGSEPPAKPAPAAGLRQAFPQARRRSDASKARCSRRAEGSHQTRPVVEPNARRASEKVSGAIGEAVIFRNMPSLIVAKESLIAMCEFLKSPRAGNTRS